MNITYLDGNEANVKRLARAVFPHYRGRKFSFQVVETVALTGTYWDGGSRSSYGGVSLADYSAATVPQFEPPQFGGPTQAPTVEVTPGMEDEKIVLLFTGSLKNTYGGRSNVRYTEAHSRYGITADRWTAAQEALKARKLLRANGSITPAGRNVDTGEYR